MPSSHLPLLAVITLGAAGCTSQPFTIDVPLRVVATSPSGGAEGAARDTVVTATFSEDLRASSIGAGTVTVARIAEGDEAEDVAVAGVASYDAARLAVAFTPERLLEWSRRYRLTLTTGILRERDGGPLPTTVVAELRVADPPPLALIGATPSAGATGVATDTAIVLAFSEPVRCSTVDAAHIVVTETSDSHPRLGVDAGVTAAVAGAFTCHDPPSPDSRGLEDTQCGGAADPCAVTFVASRAFARSSLVTVSLAGGPGVEAVESARATATGGQLPAPVTVPFVVVDPPALLVAGATPGAGSRAVPRGAELELELSEEVSCATFGPATVSLVEVLDPALGGATAPVSVAVLCVEPASVVTLVPAAPFAYSSVVTVALAGGAFGQDDPLPWPGDNLESAVATTRGGQLVRSLTYAVTIEDPPPLRLVASVPGDGATGVARESAPGTPVPFSFSFSEGLRRPDGGLVALGSTPAAADGKVYVEDVTALVAAGADARDPTRPGTAIAGTIAFAAPDGVSTAGDAGTDSTFTFTPAAPLPFATWVRVTLRAAPGPSLAGLTSDRVTSKGGQLDATRVILFAIEAPPPLRVLFTAPSDGGRGVAIGSDFEVVFSEDVDCVSVGDITGSFAATDPFGGAYDGVAAPNTAYPAAVHECAASRVVLSPATLDAQPGASPGYEYSRDVAFTLPTSLCAARHLLVNTAADPTLGCLPVAEVVAYGIEDPPPVYVLEANPAGGAVGVARAQPVRLRFSEPVENPAGVAVTCASGCVGAAALGHASDVVTLTPATPDWRYSETMTVTVAGGSYAAAVRGTRATPRGGFVPATRSWSFNAADMPPLVLLATNAAGATTFDRTAPIELVFGGGADTPVPGAVDCATVTASSTIAAGSLFVYRTATGSAADPATHLPTTITCPSGAANKVVVRPVDTTCGLGNTALCFDTSYTVVITDAVCHAAKSSLDVDSARDGCVPSPYRSFALATQAPAGLKVLATAPADGEQNVGTSTDTVLAVTFNNSVVLATVTSEPGGPPAPDGVLSNVCITKGANVTTNCDAGVDGVDSIDVDVVSAADGPELRIEPRAALALDTWYTLVITKDVVDSFGDRLDSFYSATFKTKVDALVDAVVPAPLDDVEGLTVTVLFSRDVVAASVPNGIYLTYPAEDGRTVPLPATVTLGTRSGASCNTPGTCNTTTSAGCDCAVLTPSLATLLACQGRPAEAWGNDGAVVAAAPSLFTTASRACAPTDAHKTLVITAAGAAAYGAWSVAGCSGASFALTGSSFGLDEGELPWRLVPAPATLPYGTQVTVHLAAGIRSADGTMHVTPTAGDELTIPFVTGTGPLVSSIVFANGVVPATALAGASDVPYDASLRVGVSEPLDPAALDGADADATLRTVLLVALRTHGLGETAGTTVVADAPGVFLGAALSPSADNLVVDGVSTKITAVSADGRTATTAYDFGATRRRNATFVVSRGQAVAVDVTYTPGATTLTLAPAIAQTADPTGLTRLLHPGTDYLLTLRGRTRTNARYVVAADGEALRDDVSVSFTTSRPFAARFQPAGNPNGTVSDIGAGSLAYVDFTRAVDRLSVTDVSVYAVQGGALLSAILATTLQDVDAALYVPVPTFEPAVAATLSVTAAVRDERGNPLVGGATCGGVPCSQITYPQVASPPAATSQELPTEVTRVVRDRHDTADATGQGSVLFKLGWIVDGNTDVSEYVMPSSVDTDSVTLCYDPANDGCVGDETIAFAVEFFANPGVDNGVYLRPLGTLDAAKGPRVRLEVDRAGLANVSGFNGAGLMTPLVYVLDTAPPTVTCAGVAVSLFGGGTGTLAANADAVSPESSFVATFSSALEAASVVDPYGGCRNLTLVDTTAAVSVPLGCAVEGAGLTVTPLRALSLVGAHTQVLTFTTGVRDDEHTPLAAPVACTFHTIDGAATDALTAVVSPAGGAQALDVHVQAVFNHRVDPATLLPSTTTTAGTVRVVYDTGAACGDDLDAFGCVTLGADGKTVTFEPAADAPLVGGTAYDVLLASAIDDEAHSGAFAGLVLNDQLTTVDAAPRVLCTTAAATNPLLTLHLNEAVDPTTVAGNVWVFVVAAATAALEGADVTAFSVDAGTPLELRLSVDLGAAGLVSGDVVGVIVTDGVTDTTGAPLVEPLHTFVTVP